LLTTNSLPPTDGPRNINMPGFRQVVRCSQCGAVIEEEVGINSRCPRCGTELHTCSQCESFDPGARFECMQAVTTRVTPKNYCQRVHALLAPHHGRTRDDNAARRRRAEGV
jgi:NAD-dependent SIR2 family protein deacetylase